MRQRVLNWLFVGLMGASAAVLANPAEDGNITITGPYTANSYTTLSAAAAATSPSFDVASVGSLALPACRGVCANSAPTAGNGFGTPLAVDDLLMIYQPQKLAGAITVVNDPTFGNVVDYGQAGLYELVYVSAIAGNTISINTTAGGGNCMGLK